MAKLAAYAAKRDFDKTAEPRGEEGAAAGSAFVIQKHDASRLHYDLRLELDGVMLSWAVAKGPSLVPGDKRLAIHVEDHPIAYNTFEGTIPKGQYGGGTVLLWDRGEWAPEADPRKGMKKGHLDFRLDGEKLRGRFHLVRLRKKAGEKQEAWLLMKAEDEFARADGDPDILEEAPLSVATGRDLPAIAAEKGGATWDTDRGSAAEARATAKGRTRSAAAADDRDKSAAKPAKRAVARAEKRDPMPRQVEPCLATLVSTVPGGAEWLHEIKWDGYRLLVFRTRGTVTIRTRRGHDWTSRFPAIAEAVAALPVDDVVLDGEGVVAGETGVSSFSALQKALSDEGGRIARDAVLYAFDLLYLDGEDLRALPLAERKARLATLVRPEGPGALRLSEHLEGGGAAMVRNACRLGLEGVISKRADKPYRSGRGLDWVKTKCTDRQEFVIGGFAPSGAAKRAIGSLLLGFHEGGALVHAGRSGTGFTAESARDLWKRLEPMKRARSPFDGSRLTAAERRDAVYVEPTLVAEIEFRGWTDDRHLRHAAFKGLREDKAPDEIVREVPADATPEPAPAHRRTRAAKAPAGGDAVAGVTLTHPERVLWDHGLTKKGLAEYYAGIADWILPQIAGRPLSLVRCPNGAGDKCFFQKHSWAGLGESVRREMVRDEGGEEEVLYVEDIAGIVSLVQASVLEIHPWGATIADVDRPDRIVMDLDPGEGVAWADIVAGARDLRERLGRSGLESFVKTTGGKGLHVVVPLRPDAAWATVKAFAADLSATLERDSPERYVAKSAKAARTGRIYVDYLRNGRGATAVAAYSTRARPGATVAVPLAWEELSAGLDPASFTTETVPRRLARLKADPWAAMAGLDQGLPQADRPVRKRK